MPTSALSTYAGRPLSPSHRSFLEFLVAKGFTLDATGSSRKTLRIRKDAKDIGYVNGTVVQRGALFGYHFAADGHHSDACPPALADTLAEWACRRFLCSEAEIDVHSGAGSNAGRTFLLLKSASAALRALQVEAGTELQSGTVVIQQAQRYVEGRVVDVVAQRRERDPLARAACLAEYGFDCFVCGTNLRRRYAELQFELVHVHHEEPLAQARGEREFDPIATMKPLCPNCHCVAHARTPPYTIAELREMLRSET